MRGTQVIVIGAGIAGLAAAIALARRGAEVRVVEQAPAIAELGAGLQISPNGAAVLRALGLGPALARAGTAAAAAVLREGADGRRLIGFELPAPGRAGAGSWLVHRADLIALLAEGAAAAGVGVEAGRRVAEVRPGRPARIRFADGAEAGAGLVVGADGIHSVARAAVGPAPPAAFTGQVAWRALIPGEGAAAPPVAEVFLGPGRHLVSYPLRGGRLRNLVAVEERRAWAAEGWNHRDDPAALRAAFAGFGGPVPGWLAQVEELHLWGLFRHPVAARWWAEGVVLLGDAAHPTLPFLAQGANLALEDAWVLAACLDHGTDPAAGLAAYQAARAGRVRRIVAAAGANARAFHLRGPARAAAHAALRIADRLAPWALRRRLDRIWRHDVTATHP